MSTELIAVWGVDLKEQSQSKFGLEEFASKGTAFPRNSFSQRVLDHFRCPENFLDFAANGRMSSDADYFRFGPNTICYGRSCGSIRDSGGRTSPYDVLADVVINDGKVGLAFDPTEVIDNLRLERYANNRGNSAILQEDLLPLPPLHKPFDQEANSAVSRTKLARLQLSPLACRHHG